MSLNTLNPAQQAFYQRYLQTLPPEHPHHQAKVTADHFCGDEINANACAELIAKGLKTATCSLYEWYARGETPPQVGDLMLVLNWQQEPTAIIETTQVAQRAFDQIDEEWAAAEGEGDRSLAFWQAGHKAFFQADCQNLELEFSEAMPLLLERFTCVYPAYEGPRVQALARNPEHGFHKFPERVLELIAGEGVVGDAHRGKTVKHRSRVKQDPTQPNLRQVHLLHSELFTELAEQGFQVQAGQLGENICTSGLDLLNLPRESRLKLGTAELQITGLRNPCAQINQFQAGLLDAVLERNAEGALIRKAGVMAIVLQSGRVREGDPIELTLPPEPHQPLERV